MMSMVVRQSARAFRVGLVWLGIFLIAMPMLWALLTSLKPKGDTLTFPVAIWPESFTFESYSTLLFDTMFVQLFLNSVVVAVGTTLLVLIVGTLGAYGLTRFKFRGAELGAATILFTYFLPSTIIVVPIYLTINQLGLSDTLTGLVLSYTTFALPFALWMLRLFFQTLPVEIEQAARVDGASRLGLFFEIVLPQALPGIIATSLFTFIIAYNEYLFSFIFINSDAKKTLPVGINFIVKTSYEIEWNIVMAASVLMTLPVLIVIVSCQRYLLSGFGVGNTKG
ncbi:ABC transporter permease [Agaricicola taiwanensis]|uniref:ABC transporter permease n=1 Tax=Agaricicola taiwanensis TaxID=591372 RepID=A0A8J2YH67_9RHOB|nr:carbohydrate ABC transporter permease [Agaricicola taiwanensis]GGE41175.1 ABC transporter permease [Agaricicola taiwanensis]